MGERREKATRKVTEDFRETEDRQELHMAASVTGNVANKLTAPGPVALFPPSKIVSP